MRTQPLQILYAEDNATLGEIIVRVLQCRGHFAEHAIDGLKAWERIETDIVCYDVVVTDHEMPRLTGLDFVARLVRADYHGRIIVYTSSLTDELAAQYWALGVHTLVTKSSKAEDLIDAIEAPRVSGQAAGMFETPVLG